MDVAHLKIEFVPIDSIHEDQANARDHGPRSVQTLDASLREFNQFEPLVVQRSTGRIIGGNERWRRLKALGARNCNVIMLDVDNTTATRMAIVSNRAGEHGQWNQTLVEQLEALKQDGHDIATMGFDDDEFAQVLADLKPPEFDPAPIEDQSRLDEKNKVTCPECGHAFIP